ncbi:MAG: LPS assembly lipoprotein LptE [Deltaproteobacteria bacterium]|nr:LPS assembly lipoprotein LptE [Deltaproteobacteria bacterium]
MSLRFLIVLCLFALLVQSCGYQIVREKGIYEGKIKSIYLSGFKNATFEPHISMYVTDVFGAELLSLGLFEINKPSSEASLEGLIRRVTIGPQTVDKKGIAVEKNIELEIELSLISKEGMLIKKWILTERETFRVDDPNSEDYNRREAIKRAAAKIARRFTSLIFMEY